MLTSRHSCCIAVQFEESLAFNPLKKHQPPLRQIVKKDHSRKMQLKYILRSAHLLQLGKDNINKNKEQNKTGKIVERHGMRSKQWKKFNAVRKADTLRHSSNRPVVWNIQSVQECLMCLAPGRTIVCRIPTVTSLNTKLQGFKRLRLSFVDEGVCYIDYSHNYRYTIHKATLMFLFHIPTSHSLFPYSYSFAYFPILFPPLPQ